RLLRSRVSSTTSAVNVSRSMLVAVRQTPFTATLPPSARRTAVSGASIRSPWPAARTRPTSLMIPVNISLDQDVRPELRVPLDIQLEWFAGATQQPGCDEARDRVRVRREGGQDPGPALYQQAQNAAPAELVEHG